MVECVREVCPAGDRCCNQRFLKRQYPNVYPFKTSERGWGLKTKDFVKKGNALPRYSCNNKANEDIRNSHFFPIKTIFPKFDVSKHLLHLSMSFLSVRAISKLVY